jgi:hypothetical protein
MSGNYGIDADDVASNDDALQETENDFDANQAEETRLAGVIINQ